MNVAAPSHTLRLSEWNRDLINPRYSHLIRPAAAITISAIGAIAMPWKSSRVWGATVLVAVGYGIINDLFACRVCPEYFTVRHIYDGQNTENRLVKTLDPNVNALAWGVVATTRIAAYGGVVLAVGASISGGDEKTIIVSMICLASIALVVADIVSRCEKSRVEAYRIKIYPNIPDQLQSSWYATETRNSMGNMSLQIGVVALSILMFMF